jgi:hypothetical protein
VDVEACKILQETLDPDQIVQGEGAT